MNLRRLALGCILLALQAARGQAYSDPALFDMEPVRAGGGGRLFTGSPEDGYSCSVCHRGGKPPELELTGLPEQFEPGQLYQVRLRWDGQAASHALHLELVDEDGAHPDVVLEPDSVLDADGRCDADPEGEPAFYGIDRGARRVIGVRDCGANRVSFQFSGPRKGDALFFAASFVRTDSSGTAAGDGVLDLRRTIRRQGASSGAGCQALDGRPRHDLGAWLLAVLLALRSFSATGRRASRCTQARARG